VVVYGKPTLSRQVQKLIARKDIELVVIKSKLMGPFNPYGNAKEIADETICSQCGEEKDLLTT
jgi:hypothetical protein